MSTQVSSEAPPSAASPNLKERVIPSLALLSVFVVWGLLLLTDWRRDAQLQGVGDDFFSYLAAHDAQSAYELLSSERRAKLSLEDFSNLTHDAVFRRNFGYSLGELEEHAAGFCTKGGWVDGPGGRWSLQMYLVAEAGEFRLRSFALQQPANQQMDVLLPECGYRVKNHRGPAFARATKPLDPPPEQ